MSVELGGHFTALPDGWLEEQAEKEERREPTFTPGPWHDEITLDGDLEVQDGQGRTVAYLGDMETTDEADHANARLIAAAPKMAALHAKVYRALVAHEAGEYLDASSLFVEIGDVLREAGIEGFGVEPES